MADTHWSGEHLQKIGRGRVKTCILCGAEDGALGHLAKDCPFPEMFPLGEVNSAMGRKFVERACEIMGANYGRPRRPEFILPYERGTRRRSKWARYSWMQANAGGR